MGRSNVTKCVAHYALTGRFWELSFLLCLLDLLFFVS